MEGREEEGEEKEGWGGGEEGEGEGRGTGEGARDSRVCRSEILWVKSRGGAFDDW